MPKRTTTKTTLEKALPAASGTRERENAATETTPSRDETSAKRPRKSSVAANDDDSPTRLVSRCLDENPNNNWLNTATMDDFANALNALETYARDPARKENDETLRALADDTYFLERVLISPSDSLRDAGCDLLDTLNEIRYEEGVRRRHEAREAICFLCYKLGLNEQFESFQRSLDAVLEALGEEEFVKDEKKLRVVCETMQLPRLEILQASTSAASIPATLECAILRRVEWMKELDSYTLDHSTFRIVDSVETISSKNLVPREDENLRGYLMRAYRLRLKEFAYHFSRAFKATSAATPFFPEQETSHVRFIDPHLNTLVSRRAVVENPAFPFPSVGRESTNEGTSPQLAVLVGDEGCAAIFVRVSQWNAKTRVVTLTSAAFTPPRGHPGPVVERPQSLILLRHEMRAMAENLVRLERLLSSHYPAFQELFRHTAEALEEEGSSGGEEGESSSSTRVERAVRYVADFVRDHPRKRVAVVCSHPASAHRFAARLAAEKVEGIQLVDASETNSSSPQSVRGYLQRMSRARADLLARIGALAGTVAQYSFSPCGSVVEALLFLTTTTTTTSEEEIVGLRRTAESLVKLEALARNEKAQFTYVLDYVASVVVVAPPPSPGFSSSDVTDDSRKPHIEGFDEIVVVDGEGSVLNVVESCWESFSHDATTGLPKRGRMTVSAFGMTATTTRSSADAALAGFERATQNVVLGEEEDLSSAAEFMVGAFMYAKLVGHTDARLWIPGSSTRLLASVREVLKSRTIGKTGFYCGGRVFPTTTTRNAEQSFDLSEVLHHFQPPPVSSGLVIAGLVANREKGQQDDDDARRTVEETARARDFGGIICVTVGGEGRGRSAETSGLRLVFGEDAEAKEEEVSDEERKNNVEEIKTAAEMRSVVACIQEHFSRTAKRTGSSGGGKRETVMTGLPSARTPTTTTT